MTSPQDSYRRWADAHVFYHTPYSEPATEDDTLRQHTHHWRARLIDETPHGGLLTRNTMFDALAGHSTLHLLHVTHAYDKITRRGVIYPSGGCLVGSVYTTLLTPERNGLRPHNLGDYILTREAPALAARRDTTATPLIIDVRLPDDGYRGLAGLDYLRLGDIHLAIFRDLEYLLSRDERHALRDTVTRRVKNSAAFLSLCSHTLTHDHRSDANRFLDALGSTVTALPILGYFYFEAIAEYLMLHAGDPTTLRLRERGELNNWLYKDLLYNGFPAMTDGFNLAAFAPSAARVRELLGRADPNLDLDHAAGYLASRLAYLITSRLFTRAFHPQDWHHIRWEFDDLCRFVGPLVGHLIHRELRSFGRWPDFYFYYDQLKAIQVWNYWNHSDVVVPFNGVIPKGELGINPAYPGLDYTIHRADVDDAGLLHRAEALDLTIAPRLVDLQHTLMRTTTASLEAELADIEGKIRAAPHSRR